MSYLQRIKIRLEAAKPKKGRSNVRDNLGDEEQQPSKQPQENKQQQKTPEPPAKSEDQESPDEQPETPQDSVGTGASNLKAEGRLAEIRYMKPWLFVISGSTAGNLVSFFKDAEVKSVLDNKKLSERIFGKSKFIGLEKNPKELVFAYFVASNFVELLSEKAKKLSIAVTKKDFERDLKASNPFLGVKLIAATEEAAGTLLRKGMQESLNLLLEDESDLDEVGKVTAMQMESVIPLDYMRFLGKDNKKKQFHLGGHPDGAGREGMIYALCTSEESKLFIRTVKEFHPLPNFVDDMHFVSIDAAFKKTKPREVVVDNCLILETKGKFDVHKKSEQPPEEDKKQLAAKAAEPAHTSKDGETVLGRLDFYASEISKMQGIRNGQYVKGTHVQGNLVAHFSADMKRCILWCGSQPITLDKDLEEQMTEEFDLAGIDKTFMS